MKPEAKRILKALGILLIIIACFIIVILTAGCFGLPAYKGVCRHACLYTASVVGEHHPVQIIIGDGREHKH